MMNLTIRMAVSHEDFERIAALMRVDDPESLATGDSLLEDESHLPAGSVSRWAVAEDEANGIVGMTYLIHMSWASAHTFRFRLVVDRPHRNRGVGSHLYKEALAFLIAEGARSVKASIADDCPECLRFAEARGFRIWRHIFNSALDLTSYDERPFVGALDRAEASGIRFVSLTEWGDTEEARHRLYHLRAPLGLDAPNSSGFYPPYEQFRRGWFDTPYHDPAGIIIAIADDEWIGLAMVGYIAEEREAFNGFTGVLAPYRGRGIAQALKVLANRYALSCGARSISTGNDSANAPMLAINEKMGYARKPGRYGVEVVLQPQT